MPLRRQTSPSVPIDVQQEALEMARNAPSTIPPPPDPDIGVGESFLGHLAFPPRDVNMGFPPEIGGGPFGIPGNALKNLSAGIKGVVGGDVPRALGGIKDLGRGVIQSLRSLRGALGRGRGVPSSRRTVSGTAHAPDPTGALSIEQEAAEFLRRNRPSFAPGPKPKL